MSYINDSSGCFLTLRLEERKILLFLDQFRIAAKGEKNKEKKLKFEKKRKKIFFLACFFFQKEKKKKVFR